jgi:hypothetical protein
MRYFVEQINHERGKAETETKEIEGENLLSAVNNFLDSQGTAVYASAMLSWFILEGQEVTYIFAGTRGGLARARELLEGGE